MVVNAIYIIVTLFSRLFYCNFAGFLGKNSF